MITASDSDLVEKGRAEQWMQYLPKIVASCKNKAKHVVSCD